MISLALFQKSNFMFVYIFILSISLLVYEQFEFVHIQKVQQRVKHVYIDNLSKSEWIESYVFVHIIATFHNAYSRLSVTELY